jgi:hypothetical protein
MILVKLGLLILGLVCFLIGYATAAYASRREVAAKNTLCESLTRRLDNAQVEIIQLRGLREAARVAQAAIERTQQAAKHVPAKTVPAKNIPVSKLFPRRKPRAT